MILVHSAHLAQQAIISRIENLKHNPGANNFESSSPKYAEDRYLFESATEKFGPTGNRTRAPKQRLFPKASPLTTEPNAALTLLLGLAPCVECPALYRAIGGNFRRTTLQRLFGKFIEKRNYYLRKLLFYYSSRSQLLHQSLYLNIVIKR